MENKKISIAKELLKDKKIDFDGFGESLHEADKHYVGKMLEEKENQYTKWVLEVQVEIEALEKFIKDTEDFEQLDADQSKAEEQEQERLADNAQEHAQEMLAEELSNNK